MAGGFFDQNRIKALGLSASDLSPIGHSGYRECTPDVNVASVQIADLDRLRKFLP
jgi:hypothetical protein